MRPAQLTGSHADGILQIAEAAINDVLRVSAGAATAPVIELLPGNGMVLRYGMWHARLELPSVVDADEVPRVTFVLASVLVAWGLKAFVRQPFVEIHGRHLTVDLAAVPALAEWRDLWKYLQQLTFATAPGALRVGFVVAINGGHTADDNA